MNLDNLHGEELFSYLRTNKKELLQTKKSSLKLSDSLVSTVVVTPREIKTESSKDAGSNIAPSEPLGDSGSLDVTIVCNAAWFCDSQMDVITDKAYTESVKSRGTSIPHIADHKQTSTSHVGDVTKVYTKVLALTELGLDQEGTTTVLLMDSTVRKDYNEDVFKFYSNGKINQHSIGLTYSELKLAINSVHESDKVEKAIWDANYPKVINKDIVDKRGYFYLIPKVDIRENSCVLFGSNPLTPTLSVKSEQLDSFIGNEESIIKSTQLPKGTIMTLEEAQGKIIALTEELGKAKSEITLSTATARIAEKQRCLDIIKAQKAFGSDVKLQDAAVSFIDKDANIETVIMSFEVIKGALQDSTHVDTTEAQGSLDKPTATKSFAATLDKALDQVGTTPNYFAGIK